LLDILLLLLAVALGSVVSSPSTGEADRLYATAVGTLEGLEPRSLVTPIESSKTLPTEASRPIIVRALGYVFRHYVAWILPDFLFGSRRGVRSSGALRQIPETLSGGKDSREIPVIQPSDSKGLKRAKALRLLEIAGYQMDHQPSLMTLGNLYLVNIALFSFVCWRSMF
jgi:hypothetical protein